MKNFTLFLVDPKFFNEKIKNLESTMENYLPSRNNYLPNDTIKLVARLIRLPKLRVFDK